MPFRGVLYAIQVFRFFHRFKTALTVAIRIRIDFVLQRKKVDATNLDNFG